MHPRFRIRSKGFVAGTLYISIGRRGLRTQRHEQWWLALRIRRALATKARKSATGAPISRADSHAAPDECWRYPGKRILRIRKDCTQKRRQKLLLRRLRQNVGLQ